MMTVSSYKHMIIPSIFLNYHTVAVAGVEQTHYTVSEGVGYVELCAVVIEPTIVCPINFSFNVRLQTANGTAGKQFLLKHSSQSFTVIFI